MVEVWRCDTCGREWRVRARRPVPWRVEGHYRTHGSLWDGARFTVRPS